MQKKWGNKTLWLIPLANEWSRIRGKLVLKIPQKKKKLLWLAHGINSIFSLLKRDQIEKKNSRFDSPAKWSRSDSLGWTLLWRRVILLMNVISAPLAPARCFTVFRRFVFLSARQRFGQLPSEDYSRKNTLHPGGIFFPPRLHQSTDCLLSFMQLLPPSFFLLLLRR